jgi:hypothetical protein
LWDIDAGTSELVGQLWTRAVGCIQWNKQPLQLRFRRTLFDMRFWVMSLPFQICGIKRIFVYGWRTICIVRDIFSCFSLNSETGFSSSVNL